MVNVLLFVLPLCVSLRKVLRNMNFNKFIRIITEGGTRSEIDSICDTILDWHKKYDNYDFWEEHIK